MADLIDQFCAAIDEYLKETRDASANVADYLIHMTGGIRFIEGDGKLPDAELTLRSGGARSLQDRYGTYNTEHLREWLRQLVNGIGMSQSFIVPSMIRLQERFLMRFLLNSEEAAHRREVDIRELERLIADQHAREEYFAVREALGHAEVAETDAERIDVLRSLRDTVRRLTPEPEDRSREKLNVWQTHTRSIGSDENVARYEDGELRKWVAREAKRPEDLRGGGS